MREELPFERILTGYGLTEAGTVTGCKPDDDFEHIATTVGVPWPGFEVRIVTEVGRRRARPGEPGEVVVRGETVTRGYLDDPDATAAAIDADGWLHTGDLGTIDADGYLRIVGRIKDMFIVGGFNAYPAEIENLMLRHPRIAQVAVIGVPDERLGEVAKAFVVLRARAADRAGGDHRVGARGDGELQGAALRRVPRRAAGERDRQGREGRAPRPFGARHDRRPYETILYDDADRRRHRAHHAAPSGAARTRSRTGCSASCAPRSTAVDADPDVRAVVVTGSGRAFCAGADLGSGERTFSGGKRTGRDPGGVVALRIFDCTKPVIAAVNGPAIGVGASMTLAMDARFAAPTATFGFVFTRLGIVPEACSSWFLPAARRHPDRARLADVGPAGHAPTTRWPSASRSTSPTTS